MLANSLPTEPHPSLYYHFMKAQTWASVVKDATNTAVVSAQVRQTLKQQLLDSLENWQSREKGNGDSRAWDGLHSSSHRINLG